MYRLDIFDYNSNEVQTVIVDNTPWFVAKDVCDVLELTDVSKSLERLDEDEKMIRKLFVSSKQRDVWVINEF